MAAGEGNVATQSLTAGKCAGYCISTCSTLAAGPPYGRSAVDAAPHKVPVYVLTIPARCFVGTTLLHPRPRRPHSTWC